MGFSGVPELRDKRMPLERLLHDPALDPLASAVNEADFAQARLMGCVHVLFDDRLDIPRRERMQIQAIFNRNAVLLRHRMTDTGERSVARPRASAIRIPERTR